MSGVKSLWASVQKDPKLMRKVNGWSVWLWILMVPISLVTGLIKSLVFISAMSLWALVTGHLAAWQASRVEVAQEEDANVSDVLEEVQELKASK